MVKQTNLGKALERRGRFRAAKKSGMLIVELVVALAILAIAMIPLMGSFGQMQKAARGSYQHAVAVELVDGEMEILLAGEWRGFKQGTQAYPLRADALKNLPPGRAELTVAGKHVKLEWLPEKRDAGGKVLREADAK